MTRPLSLRGLSVVEISDDAAGALCAALLADLGADVVKLRSGREDPSRRPDQGARGRELADTLVDGRKRIAHVADLGAEAVAERLSRADVLVLGWEPGHGTAPAGFEDLDVTAGHGERTIACHLSPFGADGPLADVDAADLTVQAASGVMATTGEPGGRPLRAGADLGAAVGALYGVIGICAALIERIRSGRGQVVEVAIFDCLVSTLTQFASRVLGGVPPLPRLGNQGPNTAPWNLFHTRDGQAVFIIAGSNPTFTRLCAVMGRPELASDPRFDTNAHRRESKELVTGLVAEWAMRHDAAEIIELLRNNGVPVSLVATTSDVLADAHFAYRELLETLTADGGQRQVAGSPLGRWTPADAPAEDVASRGALSTDHSRPLDGVRVVDLGTLTAGPFSCRLLGNLGADIVKVEPPGGESGRHSPPLIGEESVYFHMTNNDKRSISIDLSSPDGQRRVAELLTSADIVIENQSPGALSKRGLGASDMLAVNPDLLYVSVTGYGHSGPLGGLRAYDTVIQAAGGLLGLTGEAGRGPVKTGISSADVLGSLCATASALAGLYGRHAGHHRGAAIDVALFDGIAWATQTHWPSVLAGAAPHARQGNGHWAHAPQGVYDTRDGLVAIAVESDRQWAGLCRVLERFEVALPAGAQAFDRARRWSARADLDVSIATACAGRDLGEVLAACREQRVPIAPVLEVGEALDAAQVKARGLIVDVALADRSTMQVLNIPVRLSRTPGYVSHRAPAVPAGPDLVD